MKNRAQARSMYQASPGTGAVDMGTCQRFYSNGIGGGGVGPLGPAEIRAAATRRFLNRISQWLWETSTVDGTIKGQRRRVRECEEGFVSRGLPVQVHEYRPCPA